MADMTGGPAPIEQVATAVAVLAVAQADSGATPEDLIRSIWPFLKRHGLDNSTGLRIIGVAIQHSPVEVDAESWSARHRAVAILDEAALRMERVDT
ncbi:hypothetical protein D0Z08_29800 [Nocardioides immobilis]|uniref:Uncharacterized protein n=1 Tax=Nocardioides immobilis TaxID=2049295 RepID=A0A417XSG7_9ACTN|nr:hypothetical protein D0Z08_29800 [Nocardioides immobilis]